LHIKMIKQPFAPLISLRDSIRPSVAGS